MNRILGYIASFLYNLALLAIAVAIIYFLTQKPLLVGAPVHVHGNNLISEAEVLAEIEEFDLTDRAPLWNKLSAARTKLKKHPLIKRARIKRSVYPTQITVVVEEEQPWGIYKSQLFDRKLKTLASSAGQKVSVQEVYAGYQFIVKLRARKDLTEKKFKLIHKIHQEIEKFEQKLELESNKMVTYIYPNADNNWFIDSTLYKYKLGFLDNTCLERVQRIHLLADKVSMLEDEIEYFDLSLNTKDIIIGRKKRNE